MRRVVQLLALLLFVYLLVMTRWPVSDTVLVDAFLTLDPLLSTQAALASRTWVDALPYGLALLALTLVLGRFFCGWLCPFGTCLEWGDELIYKGKKRKWRNHERRFRGVKYAILVIIFVGALFGQSLAYLADPICWATRIGTYALFPMGAVVGDAFLETMQPLFESLGWMNLARAQIDPPFVGALGVFSLLLFALLLWLGRYQRRFWCRVLCPLGALLAIPARWSLFGRRVSDACRDDGKCARACETGAIGKDFRSYDPGECIQCGRCEKSCKFNAVTFSPNFLGTQRKPAIDLSRRQVLSSFGLGAGGALWLAYNPGRALIGDKTLRPPGALPEREFLATCVRCGECSKVCPTRCLMPSYLENGIAGLMTPIAVMRLGPCDQNCNACGLVCPTGAIRPLDLVEKSFAKIGNAIIEPGRCVVWEQGKHCLVCDENCPYGAIYWQEVASGERRPFVNENRCNGCGQCEIACPIVGVSAIRITPAGQIRLRVGSYEKEGKDRGMVLEHIDRIT